MKLTLSLDEFNDGIRELTGKASTLRMSVDQVSSFEQFDRIVILKKEWLKECEEYLTRSFEGDNSDYFSSAFRKSGGITYIFKLNELPRKISAFKESLGGKIRTLNGIVALLPVSDAILNPQKVIDEQRDKWSIQKKKSFLLSKLYELEQTSNYDLDYLYLANGLIQKTHNEAYQVGRLLYDEGYIDLQGGTMAHITIHGISHVEETLRELESVNQSGSINTSNDFQIITEKLDKLTELMNLNNYGNEIIFAELQELKSARGILDPKNWTQLAKGKLIDLFQSSAEDQVKDKIKGMFNYLAEEGFKLIG